MYWTDARGIHRAGLNGSGQENLLPVVLSQPTGITVDLSEGKIYWIDNSTRKVQRAVPDGTHVEDIITSGLGRPRNIVVDGNRSKVYWCGTQVDGSEGIQRANLDGTQIEDIIVQPAMSKISIRDIAVDTLHGDLYWIESDQQESPSRERIRQAALGQGRIRDVVSWTKGDVTTLAIDSVERKLYWLDGNTHLIQRVALDENDVEAVITTEVNSLMDLTVDSTQRKLFWMGVTPATQQQVVQCANLDGTELEDVLVGVNVHGIAIDEKNRKLYWTSGGVASGNPKIQCAGLDGTRIEEVIVERFQPFGVAVDTVQRKLYWTNRTYDEVGGTTVGTGSIQSATLDGIDVEFVLPDLTVFGNPVSPWNLAVDADNAKIYWSGTYVLDKSLSGVVQRANLDGSQVENLAILEEGFAFDLALDTVEGKLYWSYWPADGSDSIHRMNLDGTDMQEIVRGNVFCVAVDTAERGVYWTTGPTGSGVLIQRANLDGTNVEDILGIAELQTASWPYGIAVDTDQGKIYWADAWLEAIQRANLDGTHSEIIISDLPLPWHIAFDMTPTTPAWDVTGDGTVDILDLVAIGSLFGASGEGLAADVNQDGIVDIIDLVMVGSHFGETMDTHVQTAPQMLSREHQALLRSCLVELEKQSDGSEPFRKTVALLEHLLRVNSSFSPTQTRLLANFPNPFNPETWIPFQLAIPSDVRIDIFDTRGLLVRSLSLGQLNTGRYLTRASAAYWDGRNAQGESVSTGTYFYRFSAGDFSAVRKMMILK